MPRPIFLPQMIPSLILLMNCYHHFYNQQFLYKITVNIMKVLPLLIAPHSFLKINNLLSLSITSKVITTSHQIPLKGLYLCLTFLLHFSGHLIHLMFAGVLAQPALLCLPAHPQYVGPGRLTFTLTATVSTIWLTLKLPS